MPFHKLLPFQIMLGTGWSLGFLLDVEDAPAVFPTETSRAILIDITYASEKCAAVRTSFFLLISDQ